MTLPTLNLMYLKFFYDAVVLKSVSESAKRNFVTQSAVSQGINKLEKALNISLTTHHRQRFSLTEEGQVVFEQAKEIFQAIRTMQDKINIAKGEVSGTLNFVCTNSLGMSFIPQVFQKMHQQYPKVDVKFRLGGLNFIRTWLKQGIAEFGIVLNSSVFDQYEKRVLLQGEFRLYRHRKSNVSIEQGILVDEKEGLKVSELRTAYRQTYEEELKIQAELASWEVVARFTDQKIGLGFIPDYIARGNRLPFLEAYVLDIPPMPYEICAIYPKGEVLSRAANAFLEQFSL